MLKGKLFDMTTIIVQAFLTIYAHFFCADLLYKSIPEGLDELRNRITHHINVLKGKPQDIRQAMKKMSVNCQKCLDNNGGHIE